MKLSLASAVVLCLATSTGFAQDTKKTAPPPPVLQVKYVGGIGVKVDYVPSEEVRKASPTPKMNLHTVASVPGTAKIYTGGTDGKIYLMDFKDNKKGPVSWNAHTGYVSSLALAGKYLISAGSDHQLIWWDTETRTKVRSLEPHGKKWIRAVVATPDGKQFVSLGDDMIARLWDTESAKPIHELIGHEKLTSAGLASKLHCCRFSPDGKRLATGDQTGIALIWDVASGKQIGKVHAPYVYTTNTNGFTYGGIRSLCFSPDGSLLALSGSIGGDIDNMAFSQALLQVYDWKTTKQTHEFLLKKNNCFLFGIHFHPKEPWIFAAAGSGESKIFLLDLKTQSVAQEIPATHGHFDMTLNESADQLIAVGSGGANLWELKR